LQTTLSQATKPVLKHKQCKALADEGLEEAPQASTTCASNTQRQLLRLVLQAMDRSALAAAGLECRQALTH
jgi:hypothetical protein